MTDAPALLPCPFCGEHMAKPYLNDPDVYSHPEGTDCFAGKAIVHPESYAAWNARARPMTVAEAAKVLLTPDEKGNRNSVYDACEKRVKVYRFDAVLRALSQGGE